jgi:hypothetical protein
MANPNIAQAGEATRFKPGNQAAARKAPSTALRALREIGGAEVGTELTEAIVWARQHPVVAALFDALEDQNARVRLDAVREFLDRVDGKPVSRQEIAGVDGEPLWMRMMREDSEAGDPV